MAATAFGEQSKAESCVRNPVTSLSQRAKAMPSNKKSLFAFIELLSSPDLSEHQALDSQALAHAKLGFTLFFSAVCRETGSSVHTKRWNRSSLVAVQSRPPRTHQDCPGLTEMFNLSQWLRARSCQATAQHQPPPKRDGQAVNTEQRNQLLLSPSSPLISGDQDETNLETD